MKKLVFVFLALSLSAFAQQTSTSGPSSASYLTASSSLLPVTNAGDDNYSTFWSSNCRVNNTDTEYIGIVFDHETELNYIKCRPRYVSGNACGFPVSFVIQYLNGSNWSTVRTETNFPKPNRSDCIVLAFPYTVSTQIIRIQSTVLGKDDVNNNVFQLAEFSAGFEQDFQNRFSFAGNDSPFKAQGANEIRNVGSGPFNPNKLSVWHFDNRKPFLTGTNIYAPSIVKNGTAPGAWNIYYGGWDLGIVNHDNIYVGTTGDNFLTVSNRALAISNVPHDHANNCSVIKDGAGWKMLYTSFPDAFGKNKPNYATSANGMNWDFNHPISMQSYPNWNNADVNGGNVLFKENGIYHLFFPDFSNFKIYHATSTDFMTYTYQSIAQDVTRVPTDLKSFVSGGQTYYLLATHRNLNDIFLTKSSDINTFAQSPSIVLNTSGYSDDKYITSVGLIADNNRLYGLLYGSSPTSTIDANKIYANWLQKKVVFQNSYVRWGDVEEAYGPDKIELFMNTQVETGRFYVYDSDGTTLLYTSPLVTMKAGDIWNYLLNDSNRTITDVKKEKISSEEKILVYPNPVNDLLHIDSPEKIDLVQVYDLGGRLLLSRNCPNKELNVSQLNKGTYLIRIVTSTGESKMKIRKE